MLGHCQSANQLYNNKKITKIKDLLVPQFMIPKTVQRISDIMTIGLWHFCLHVSSVSNPMLWARANLRSHLQLSAEWCEVRRALLRDSIRRRGETRAHPRFYQSAGYCRSCDLPRGSVVQFEPLQKPLLITTIGITSVVCLLVTWRLEKRQWKINFALGKNEICLLHRGWGMPRRWDESVISVGQKRRSATHDVVAMSRFFG